MELATFKAPRNSRIIRSATPIEMHTLREVIPSAFAEDKHESRSQRYTYIPTSEVILAMLREGFAPFAAVQCQSRIEGKTAFTKHMIRFRHASQEGVQKVGDSIPEVVLVNSHDGTSSYVLDAGVYRLVCSNGMIVREQSIDSIKVPHKGNVVDSCIEAAYAQVKQFAAVQESMALMRRLTLKPEEQRIFAEAAMALRFEADDNGTLKAPIGPDQVLLPRRHEDAGDDLWRTMNRVQENLTKGGQSGATRTASGQRRQVTIRPIEGIDGDRKLNSALWHLTQEMRKLKGE